jgi:two-component system OmpR family response regulator
MHRVMLVEDDARLAELVSEYLSSYEFAVDLVTRGDTALERFKELAPDVVILDLMLPGLDGMVVCRQIREHSDVPILILTAREDSYDEVSGLEQGADDFVNKPVQPRVLLARLRALMRRAQAKSGVDARILQFGALRIVTSDRSVVWRGQPCILSNTEYKLLLVLAEAAGRVLSRDALLKHRQLHLEAAPQVRRCRFGKDQNGLGRRLSVFAIGLELTRKKLGSGLTFRHGLSLSQFQ